MTLSKFLFLSSIFFILGVVISSLFNFGLIFILFLLIISVFFIFILLKNKFFLFFGILILFFILGFLRYDVLKNNLFISEEVILEGIISREPKETEKVKILKVNNINIFTDKYSSYFYGDKIIAQGILDESYSLFFPKIEKLEENNNIFLKNIFLFKNNLREKISKNFNYEESKILSAMILGDKDKLGNDLKEKLNISGTRHITAISGMHITIIGIILSLFLFSLGFSKNFSFYISIIFLFFYILIIGFPPSAIRALIMGSVYMISQKFGRINTNSRNLFITAFIMLLINPFLINDYGFHLSFLALFGIINFYPILKSNINLFRKESKVKELLLVTLSAYLFTFPYILYNFKEVSLIAVLSNIFAIPIVYFIMIFGFLFLIISFIIPIFSIIFLIPLWLLSFLFLSIVNIFSKFPNLKVDNINISFIIIIYCIFIYIIYLFNKNRKYAKI